MQLPKVGCLNNKDGYLYIYVMIGRVEWTRYTPSLPPRTFFRGLLGGVDPIAPSRLVDRTRLRVVPVGVLPPAVGVMTSTSILGRLRLRASAPPVVLTKGGELARSTAVVVAAFLTGDAEVSLSESDKASLYCRGRRRREYVRCMAPEQSTQLIDAAEVEQHLLPRGASSARKQRSTCSSRDSVPEVSAGINGTINHVRSGVSGFISPSSTDDDSSCAQAVPPTHPPPRISQTLFDDQPHIYSRARSQPSPLPPSRTVTPSCPQTTPYFTTPQSYHVHLRRLLRRTLRGLGPLRRLHRRLFARTRRTTKHTTQHGRVSYHRHTRPQRTATNGPECRRTRAEADAQRAPESICREGHRRLPQPRGGHARRGRVESMGESSVEFLLPFSVALTKRYPPPLVR
jgi:hypothetical protein